MRIKGAMTILNKRAEFYGKTFDELIEMIDNGFDENFKILTAHEIYKRDQGLVWCGINGFGFTTPQKSAEEYKIFRGEGVQLELSI